MVLFCLIACLFPSPSRLTCFLRDKKFPYTCMLMRTVHKDLNANDLFTKLSCQSCAWVTSGWSCTTIRTTFRLFCAQVTANTFLQRTNCHQSFKKGKDVPGDQDHDQRRTDTFAHHILPPFVRTSHDFNVVAVRMPSHELHFYSRCCSKSPPPPPTHTPSILLSPSLFDKSEAQKLSPIDGSWRGSY